MSERGADAGSGGTGHLVVGTVRKPHGVKGELQVALDTDRPRQVFRVGRSLELGDPSGRPIGRRVTVQRTRPFKEGLLVTLAESADRNAADELRGVTFLIPMDEAAPASDDEVPYHLLIGSAVLVDEERIGTVRDIYEIGGVEVLSIRRDRGAELLVPFVKEMVRGVDRERREVVIDPPDGLLDL
jgi:16S rRNA processing protein RimM